MPENRARKHHQERLGVALREEVASIVESELTDPRIGNASVTEVQLANDGKAAHVWVTIDGDDRELGRGLEGLMSAKGYIRREISERLGLRHPPELVFHVDKSRLHGNRIEELLGRVARRKR